MNQLEYPDYSAFDLLFLPSNVPQLLAQDRFHRNWLLKLFHNESSLCTVLATVGMRSYR